MVRRGDTSRSPCATRGVIPPAGHYIPITSPIGSRSSRIPDSGGAFLPAGPFWVGRATLGWTGRLVTVDTVHRSLLPLVHSPNSFYRKLENALVEVACRRWVVQ